MFSRCFTGAAQQGWSAGCSWRFRLTTVTAAQQQLFLRRAGTSLRTPSTRSVARFETWLLFLRLLLVIQIQN